MDPPPSLAAINDRDQRKGAVVHSFDPNATPDQKAAAAGKARDALNPLTQQPEAIAVGVVPVRGMLPTPTITISDVDKASADMPKRLNGAPLPVRAPSPISSPITPATTDPEVPGAVPDKPVGVIPDWYKVGWRAAAGIDDPPPTQEDHDKDIIQQWLSDMYYGQWFHNAAIIIFAVLATHLLTVLRMGLAWLFLVLATCATYYSTSVSRFRRNARDDIQRELVKNRLATEHESADWINNFLDRFWLIYEPVLSATITASVDQILSSSTPSFLDSIRLSQFTLGTTAPRIDKVRTFPRTPNDVVLMDWSLKFTPTDLTEVTPRQAEKRVNPKITLEVKVGKGPATATLPILLEDMSFEGHLRIKLKLMSAFPHVQLVEMSFLEKPNFDYVLKPLGGDTFGWDIGSIPGLSSFIREMVHSILGPMMYDPNVFSLNLEQLLSGTPLDTAVGVLQVHVVSARNLKGSKIGGGTPDPYVALSINNRAQLARTAFRPATVNPHWGSTHFLLLNQGNLRETLSLTLFDHNEHRKDSALGQVHFELQALLQEATQECIIKEIVKDGKERGELQFDVSYFPVIHPAIVDGKVERLPETNVGICRLTIHQAKDLDKSRSMLSDLNPLARVYLSGSKVPHFSTAIYRHTLNPVWEAATEFLVPNKKRSMITVKVIDDRDFLKDPIIGHMTASLEDLLEATATKGKEAWFPLSGCSSGKVRISTEWKPLDMAGNLQGAGSYTPPVGVVRLWIKKARDVKNVEATLGGKSDPYVRVMLNGVVKARTDVINNNLNPEWDQIIYVPVHSLRESLVLEVMDYQNLTKDRSLGSVELRVGDLGTETASNPEVPYSGKGKITASSPIQLDKHVAKGTLEYEAEFFPSLNIKGIEFDERNELEKAVEEDTRDSSGVAEEGEADGSVSSSDAEYEKVPEDMTVPEPNPTTVEPKPTHSKGGVSVDTTHTTGTAKTSETHAANGKDSTRKGAVAMTKEQLLHTSTGILIFSAKSGQLTKKARLEVLLDDSYWPAFATDRARSHNAKWDAVGEGFVKELDFGRVWLRLNESDDGEKENILGDFKCDTKVFLDKCLDHDEEFSLTNEEGRSTGKVIITAKYVPVHMKLEPRESINNMGVLRVDLLDGKNIASADKSGKSDPFVVFTLNEAKIFKSQTKKKTLTPSWNENFSTTVPSRVGASFNLEVFDWNQIDSAKSLGVGPIDLADLEPFSATEKIIFLSSSKHGEKGEVRLRLLFQPEIIAKSRKNTSTFSTAGRAMTQLGTMPLGAGRGMIHGVESMGKMAKGVFGKPKSIDEGNESETSDAAAGQVSAAVPSSAGAAIANNTAAAPGEIALAPESGSVKVMAVGAKDLSMAGESSVKPYLVLKVGKEEFKTKHAGKTTAPEWDETFAFATTAETRNLGVTIYDHKTLGKDKALGEAEIDIWRHLQPNGGLTAADVWVELRNGSGQLHLRLEYERGGGVASIKSGTLSSGAARLGLGSPSRFSLSKRQTED